MPPPPRLGGFKTLNDVVRISTVFKYSTGFPPPQIVNLVSRERVNIVYLSYLHHKNEWSMTLAINSRDEQVTCDLLKSQPDQSFFRCTRGVILSVFPHRKNPEIPGSLLEIFGREKIEIDALTTSPSAISVIMDKSLLNRASQALFEPFTFSSYRTPADWKLAQKGREELYKEVVASYQETYPKVYGLEYHQDQEFIRLDVNSGFAGKLGQAFRKYAALKLHLTFLSFTPQDGEKGGLTAFCFPVHDSPSSREVLEKNGLKTDLSVTRPVTVFSMNGPHFGDRHGIAAEIMKSFHKGGVHLLGLNCTIASITGVVPSRDFEKALHCIQSCFEVPNIIKKN